MSSGSFFTIYRKCKDVKLENSKLKSLKDEYRKSSKESSFSLSKDDLQSQDDLPKLMHEDFTAGHFEDDNKSNRYYDKDGTLYEKLLEFHFCSSFTCLKEKFMLNACKQDESSTFISKNEAEKMLQAINYILSEEYSKKFEDILNNEYVSLFGNGYFLFDNRFKHHKDSIYVDKDGDNYILSFGDRQWDVEIADNDDDIKFSLSRVRSCLQAFLDAECYEFDNFDLVLEYSAY